MVDVIVQLPDHVAKHFGATPKDAARRLLEDAAIEEYRMGRLSQREVGEMLGFCDVYWETEEFFKAHGIPVNYSLHDLEDDRRTMAKLLSAQ